MLVAPTELRHAAFRELTSNGRGSGIPESKGCDFAFAARGKWFGIQRKELHDFIASCEDGRLAKEVQQMCAVVQGLLVIEGTARWDLNGNLISGGWGGQKRWTQASHTRALLSVQDAGVWVLGSSDVRDTARVVGDFEAWVKKGEHRLLQRRGPMASPFGTKHNHDYQRWLVMGLPGVDVELSERILASVGMPFVLREGMAEKLMGVRGLGKKKVAAIVAAIE